MTQYGLGKKAMPQGGPDLVINTRRPCLNRGLGYVHVPQDD